MSVVSGTFERGANSVQIGNKVKFSVFKKYFQPFMKLKTFEDVSLLKIISKLVPNDCMAIKGAKNKIKKGSADGCFKKILILCH